jgi:hypothetical protein
MADKDVITHDIDCVSNKIKDLLPKLVTRIEYNKVLSQSNSKVKNIDIIKEETTTFLRELELFVNIH